MTAKDNKNEIALARLEEKLDTLTKTVEDMNKRLYGNGKPGLIIDQETQNNQIQLLLGYAKANADNIEKLFKISAPKWFATNWITIVSIVTVFVIVLHSLIPADVSVWSLVSKWLIK